MGGMLKTIITVVVLFILFILAWKLLWFTIKILLPIAIIIIAAYLVYNFFVKKA